MKKTAYILVALMGFSSCNYLEIEPVGQVIPHKTSEYRALLTEGYFRFPYTNSKTYTGLLSDEVGLFDEGYFYDSGEALTLSYNYTWQYGNQMREFPYQTYYRAIFQANAVIAGVPTADLDTEESREQILGEAYAMRAYAHFDLVNLYGKPYNPSTSATDRGVPLATDIDIEQRFIPTNVAAVYALVLEDIARAGQAMTLERQTDSKINYRFSLDGLMAFKARVMLYMGNWQEAYNAAVSLLPKYELVDFNNLPAKNAIMPWTAASSEAIVAWERPFGGGNGDLQGASLLSKTILDLFDMENDNRSTYLKKGSYGYKADRGRNDRTSLRIAEMYLIAAEAGAHLGGELSQAKTFLLDLQAKRLKPQAMEAQRTKVEAMSTEALFTEIANERARELLLEGHRWMDLRRTTRPEIVKTHKGSTYTLRAGDSRYTLPFPQSAIDSNPDLNN